MNTTKAKAQRQKVSAKGGTWPAAARPTTALPPQNSAARVSIAQATQKGSSFLPAASWPAVAMLERLTRGLPQTARRPCARSA